MEYYICILDFEATCSEFNEVPREQREIIEFPSILYKVKGNTYELISQFHKYVKPTIHPTLTKFCTNLTAIQQTTVDSAETIEKVYLQHSNWLKQHVPANSDFIFATCGHWDIKTMLPNEIKNKKLKKNKFYSQYINVKDEFEFFYKQKVNGLSDMLKHLKLKFDGHHHSGIDDTKNIAKIVLKMIADGHHDFQLNFV
jgi:ERI1 exoribonuclease 3